MNTTALPTTCGHRLLALAAMLPAAAFIGLAGTARAGDDHVHLVRPGDTLIAIGRQLLDDPRDWVRVQRFNKVADPYRLRPGSTLRIPVALLRREAVDAEITAVKGEANVDGARLAPGDRVRQGNLVTTGDRSFATITLVDGSRLMLQPGSRLKVDHMSRRRDGTEPQTQLRLEGGRVESVVNATPTSRPRYRVTTPTATIGVRGTSFRVGIAETAAASRTEVTAGTVGVEGGEGGGRPVAVPAGYGLVAEPGGRLSKPVALLPVPDVTRLPKVQERTIVRFAVPPLAEADRYRFQVGSDAAMASLLAESLSARPEAKFADLPDGDYVLRVRGVDARGLEGRDADFPFRLKARPEPPFAVSPVGGAKLRGESPELSWTASTDAVHYRVQVASDEGFTSLVADIDRVAGTTVMPATKLAPGDYFWRTRSIRADGDAGPWGDAQRFALRPLPADPGHPAVGEDSVTFAWSGEPGQTFLFQLARDEGFVDLVAEQRLDAPKVILARPAQGTYHMRVRATDPDGFVGPFTRPQRFEVPAPPPPWWLLLMLLLPAAI